MTELYGQLKSEKLAKDRLTAHEIVKEILNLGVSDVVIANVIYELALNIENIEQSQLLACATKEIVPNAFISNLGEEK
jgi:hypothetical protein